MSMRSDFIYGYGFNSDCNEEKLLDFIKSHKETFCKSNKEKEIYNTLFTNTDANVRKENGIEDLLNNYRCDNTGMEGLGAVISNIMSRETGIRFSYCQADDDCDTLASVVFEEAYPWLFNEKEKELTEKKLSDICKKYTNELGITEESEFLALEYYG